MRLYTIATIPLVLTLTIPPLTNQIIHLIQNLPLHLQLNLLLDPIVHPYFHLITINLIQH